MLLINKYLCVLASMDAVSACLSLALIAFRCLEKKIMISGPTLIYFLRCPPTYSSNLYLFSY